LHQGVDARLRGLVGVAGEVRISGSRQDRVVTQDLLDFKQVDAVFN
jgi:hypothetical protein